MNLFQFLILLLNCNLHCAARSWGAHTCTDVLNMLTPTLTLIGRFGNLLYYNLFRSTAFLSLQVPNMESEHEADHVFKAKVSVENSDYEGSGSNKKIAKVEAAKLALGGLETLGLLKHREEQLEARRHRREGEKTEFMAKRFEERGKRIVEYRNRERKQPPLPKNAVMKLNEHHKGLDYEFLSQGGVPWNKIFSVSVTVLEQKYIATGNSKKNAKLEVAENALKGLGLWTDADQKVKDDYYGKDGLEKRRQLMEYCKEPGSEEAKKEGEAKKTPSPAKDRNRGRGNYRGRGRGWNEGFKQWRGHGRGRGGDDRGRGGRGGNWGRGMNRGGGRGRSRGSMMSEGPINFVRPNDYGNDGFSNAANAFNSQPPPQQSAPSQPFPDAPPPAYQDNQPFPDPLFANVPPYSDPNPHPEGYQQDQQQQPRYSGNW